jgi:hypothetical protein
MGLSSATEKGDYLSYAGLASLSIALIFNLFRIAFLDSGDLYKCQALLNRGDWLDDAHTNWQPDGAPPSLQPCLLKCQPGVTDRLPVTPLQPFQAIQLLSKQANRLCRR